MFKNMKIGIKILLDDYIHQFLHADDEADQ